MLSHRLSHCIVTNTGRAGLEPRNLIESRGSIWPVCLHRLTAWNNSSWTHACSSKKPVQFPRLSFRFQQFPSKWLHCFSDLPVKLKNWAFSCAKTRKVFSGSLRSVASHFRLSGLSDNYGNCRHQALPCNSHFPWNLSLRNCKQHCYMSHHFSWKYSDVEYFHLIHLCDSIVPIRPWLS